MNRQVPFLSLTYPFNPNHRLRFTAIGFPFRHLMDLSSAIGDESFYIAPKIGTEITAADGNGRILVPRIPPAGDFHISFHSSGAVNLHAVGQRLRLRETGTGRGERGLTVRFVFRSLQLFRQISIEDFNKTPTRYTPVPVVGVSSRFPLCLDVYQWNRNTPWTMPELADTFQVHVRAQPKRKHFDFHVLVWQHSATTCDFKGDVAVFYSPETPATSTQKGQ